MAHPQMIQKPEQLCFEQSVPSTKSLLIFIPDNESHTKLQV